MSVKFLGTASVCLLAFLIPFVLVPVAQLNGLEKLPGDFGDGRLNNYFLEHVYQVLAGEAQSLVHLPFYFPFPWVIALSDNLWGSAPLYLSFRLVGADPDTAFQLWWYFSFPLNFIGAYAALRILRFSVVAACVGAVIFTFAIPVTAHTTIHAQLAYRAGAPLALACLCRFLDGGSPRFLLWGAAALVWQFYATIYIGAFTLLASLIMMLAHFRFFFAPLTQTASRFAALTRAVLAQNQSETISFCIGGVVLAVLLAMLFVPYLIPASEYGLDRSWRETAKMVPRVPSYFIADVSLIWRDLDNPVFSAIPRRHEHQMFAGATVLSLVVAGAVLAGRTDATTQARLLRATLVTLVLITLSADGITLWRAFAELPLFGAIRVMTRIDLVLLFFAGGLAALCVDRLLAWRERIGMAGIALVSGLLLLEFSLVRGYSIPKAEWQNRLAVLDAKLPKPIRQNAILFVGPDLERLWQNRLASRDAGLPKPVQYDSSLFVGPNAERILWETRIEAMWIALRYGIHTANGYSGNRPPAAKWIYKDCEEAAVRIAAAEHLFGPERIGGTREEFADRLVFVNFPSCNRKAFAQAMNRLQLRAAPLSLEELSHLAIEPAGSTVNGAVTIKLLNTGSTTIIPRALDRTNLSMSWGFLRTGEPVQRFATRKDVFEPIPPGGSVEVTLPISAASIANDQELVISLLQDRVYWLHDHGLAPLRISAGKRD